MSSILTISSTTPTPTPTPRPVQPEPAATTQTPTLAQLLEEPAFELQLQAQAGNTQAATLYAQEQASNAALGTSAAGPGTLTGGLAIDFLA